MRFDSIISPEVIDIRREKVRGGTFGLTGIDFVDVKLEVVSGITVGVLEIHFVKSIDPAVLSKDNFKISGGVSVTNLLVESIKTAGGLAVSDLTLVLNGVGDSSTYSLEIVSSVDHTSVHPLFDALLSYTDFIFAIGSEDFDSATLPPSAEPLPMPPGLDYLAKDYTSFRRLILDRMATVVPSWSERNPADLGIALVEAVAFAGDQLSYYQDAVATEAYLDTARLRNSVRRHAILLDYRLHDGCNARVLLKFDLNGTAAITIKKGTMFCTNTGEPGKIVLRTTDQLFTDQLRGVHFFESMFDKTIDPALGDLRLHTWDAPNGTLAAGATSAYLVANVAAVLPQMGAVLLLYEKTADPQAPTVQVHAVRLQSVDNKATLDPVAKFSFFKVSWHEDDALPFDIRWGSIGGVVYSSGAWGNIVFADHGLSIADKETTITHTPRGLTKPLTLVYENVSFAAPVDTTLEGVVDTAPTESNSKLTSVAIKIGPVSELTTQDPRKALAAATLVVDTLTKWRVVPDLLSSDRFARDMVAENDDRKSVRLRFGDGVLGRLPIAGTKVIAHYRIGSGTQGNLGSDSLVQVVITPATDVNYAAELSDKIKDVTNPLPALGGTNGESPNEARLYAPWAFKTLERAVTESDYAAVAERHSEVVKAVARFRWTGSYYIVSISVNRKHGRPVDAPFIAELVAFVEPFRMMGHEVEIVPPEFVPLDIALQIDINPRYLRSTIKTALTELFSNRLLPNGIRGFFHPDCYTFGQPLYLSDIIAKAADVNGVVAVAAKRFKIKESEDFTTLQNAQIIVNRFSIVRCDNDPHNNDNGIIRFELAGGM